MSDPEENAMCQNMVSIVFFIIEKTKNCRKKLVGNALDL